VSINTGVHSLIINQVVFIDFNCLIVKLIKWFKNNVDNNYKCNKKTRTYGTHIAHGTVT